MLGELRRFIYNQWQEPVKRTAFLLGLGLSFLIINVSQLSLFPAIGVFASSLIIALPLASVLYPLGHWVFLTFQRQQTATKVALGVLSGNTAIIALAAHFELLFHLGVICASLIGVVICAALFPHCHAIANALKNFMLTQMPKLKNNYPFLLVMGFTCLNIFIKGVSLSNALGVLTLGAILTLGVYPLLRYGLAFVWNVAKGAYTFIHDRYTAVPHQSMTVVNSPLLPTHTVVVESPAQTTVQNLPITPLAQTVKRNKQRAVLISAQVTSLASDTSSLRVRRKKQT